MKKGPRRALSVEENLLLLSAVVERVKGIEPSYEVG
jgi:hypothetical protein